MGNREQDTFEERKEVQYSQIISRRGTLARDALCKGQTMKGILKAI